MARWHRDYVIDAPSAGLGQPADYSNYLRGQMPKLSFPRGTHGNSSLKTMELEMARWHRDHVIDAPSAGLGQPADYSNYLRGQMPTLSKVLFKLPHVLYRSRRWSAHGAPSGTGGMALRVSWHAVFPLLLLTLTLTSTGLMRHSCTSSGRPGR